MQAIKKPYIPYESGICDVPYTSAPTRANTVPGARLLPSNTWRATCTVNGREVYASVGTFDTYKEAEKNALAFVEALQS